MLHELRRSNIKQAKACDIARRKSRDVKHPAHILRRELRVRLESSPVLIPPNSELTCCFVSTIQFMCDCFKIERFKFLFKSNLLPVVSSSNGRRF